MGETIGTIVVGSALDEGSEAVVHAGAALAAKAGAQLHLVHAVAPAFTGFQEVGGPYGFDPKLLENANRAERERRREDLAAQAKRAGAASALLEDGVPHRVLSEAAARLGADLLVVGARTHDGLARLLGSTADRVVRKASCPVLVVRGDLEVPPRRPIAAVDLSPLSGEAFRRGVAILKSVSGGASPYLEALFVLGVLQRQVAPQFTPEQVDRFAAEELGRFVERHADDGGIGVARKVRVGNVREEILQELKDSGADLLILGTHGLGGFDRLVIGSVAADVIREAPCSVLVSPPPDRAGEGPG